jgi:hypothetical protein
MKFYVLRLVVWLPNEVSINNAVKKCEISFYN